MDGLFERRDLVVPPRGAAHFGNELAQEITRGGATVLSTVPTSLSVISEPLPSVRLLIVGGERCSKELVERWATPARRMLNVYGPTETTVNATVAECRPELDVTIGRPLPGYALSILDEEGHEVAPGGEGEIFIFGAVCSIDTAHCAAFDLVTIGDETSIGAETLLLGYHVEDGLFFVGSVELGSRCFVGIHSSLGLDVKMGDDALLDDLSLLPDGTTIPAGGSRRGSPAEPARVSVPERPHRVSSRGRRAVFGALHGLSIYALWLLLLPALIPSTVLLWATRSLEESAWEFVLLPLRACSVSSPSVCGSRCSSGSSWRAQSPAFTPPRACFTCAPGQLIF